MGDFLVLLWLIISTSATTGETREVRMFVDDSGSYSVSDCEQARDRLSNLLGSLPPDAIITGREIVKQDFVCEYVSEGEFTMRDVYHQNREYLIRKHLGN